MVTKIAKAQTKYGVHKGKGSVAHDTLGTDPKGGNTALGQDNGGTKNRGTMCGPTILGRTKKRGPQGIPTRKIWGTTNLVCVKTRDKKCGGAPKNREISLHRASRDVGPKNLCNQREHTRDKGGVKTSTPKFRGEKPLGETQHLGAPHRGSQEV